MKKIVYLIALAGVVLASCAKPDNNPNKERLYSFSISAERADDSGDTDDSSKTRIELINDLLYWSVGDEMGLSIYRDYYGNPIAELVQMTGDHAEPTKRANFKGHLTYDQMLQLDPAIMHYHYNASYPFDYYMGFGETFRITGHLSRESMLTKNVFPIEDVFMYAQIANAPAITWLDEYGEQQYGERTPFEFHHAFSYLRLRLDSNLTGENVTRIDMYSLIGTRLIISGLVYVYPDGGSQIHGNSDFDGEEYVTRRVIEILNGGFNIGDEIFVAMIPQQYPGASLLLKFTLANNKTYEITIPSYMNLEAGKIHPIGFNIPSI